MSNQPPDLPGVRWSDSETVTIELTQRYSAKPCQPGDRMGYVGDSVMDSGYVIGVDATGPEPDRASDAHDELTREFDRAIIEDLRAYVGTDNNRRSGGPVVSDTDPEYVFTPYHPISNLVLADRERHDWSRDGF